MRKAQRPNAAGVRPGWVREDLFPFRSRFTEVDGHLIHYVDEGSGPVLLLLHGNPTWSFLYRDAITRLRDRFRCIAPDLPGFGLSAAAAGYGYRPAEHASVIGGFIDQLGLSGIILAVQDWGGPIGLAAAARRPGRLAGLVIGNTWAWPVSGDRHFETFSAVMGGPIGAELIRDLNLFVNVMIPAGHKRRRVTRTEMSQYRAALPTRSRRQPSAIFPREITRSRDFLARTEASLPALAHLPALIVWGDADFAFREQERRRWESLLPHHLTRVLTGAGHFLQSDAPDDYAAAITTWWPPSPAAPAGPPQAQNQPS